jgi:hypothetical protein
VLVLLAAAPADARGPDVILRDPVGDASGAAADIDTLRVTSHGDSFVFRLSFANRRDLTPDDLVALVIDADADPTTGFPFFERPGIDFVVELGASGATLVDLNGMVVGLDTLVSRSGEGVSVAVDRRDLGQTQRLAVAAVTALRSDGDARDETRLARIVPSRAPKIVSSSLTITPAHVALAVGSVMTAEVAVRLDDGAIVSPTAHRCRMALGGKSVEPIAPCSWRLPRAARGKRILITARGTYRRVAFITTPRAFRVR